MCQVLLVKRVTCLILKALKVHYEINEPIGKPAAQHRKPISLNGFLLLQAVWILSRLNQDSENTLI
ncbi:unnamed protein product [Larinioides sclopetarius]|uniref:Uncharacterized protein n=1 Tax=Larinioides sclopetarius TaxID=280406 RepID=A0AAV2B6U2_9ARAC